MKAFHIILFTVVALAIAIPAHAAPLSGTKTIGPTGDYASVTAAIADVQAQTLGGALVLELQAAYVSTVETFPLTVPALNGASATNTLTLRPQSGATGLSISSSNTNAATVDLNGAQFVTIDGRPGGTGTAKQLTLANTSTSGVALRFINEGSNNTLRYLTIQGVNTNAYSGTVVFSTTTGANGNDNNTLDTCDIRDGATTPTNGIYAQGTGTTTASNNSDNLITNCNIFNFYRSNAVNTSGLSLTSGNTNWTISGNSFYQTASRVGVAALVRAIYLSNTSINSHIVTGNFIGGSAPNAGGSAWTSTGTTAAYTFVGIWLRVTNSTATSVQGNVIKNFSWSTSSNDKTQPGLWTGIYVETGAVDIGTVTGNTIGSGTGTGSISITTSGDGGMTFGICSESSGSVDISNNTVGSITAGGTTTGVGASITGIQTTKGTNTISGNLIGSTTTANSLNASTSVSFSGAAQVVAGIDCANSGTINCAITDNTVANLLNKSTRTSCLMRGIVSAAGVSTISGNTVHHLTAPSMSTGPAVVGIWHASTASGQTLSQNVVHSLFNTSNAAMYPAQNVAVVVAGIYYGGGISGTNIIERNFVHSLYLDSLNSSAELNGMLFGSGCTFTAQNNMVRVGLDASGASTATGATVRGFHDNDNGANYPRNFIHNSVYVGGTATSGSAKTYAYSSSSQNNSRDIRNNIFVNARSNSGGTGKHYAMTNGSVASPPPGLTSDFNIIYASGIGGVLGLFNGQDCSTLAEWQAATGQDASSTVGDPRFVNATGAAAAVDLHLQSSNPAEGHGVLIASVTTDLDGQTRSSLSPVDIGADAGSFTYDPAPAISYPLLSSGTMANRVLTGWATIIDDGGAVSGGASAPRLYYKKATDADAFIGNTSANNGWKYVTGTDSGGGKYSFTIDYSLIIGGVVTPGQTIQYFVVAQDASNNLSSWPAAASASANPPVQHISAKPATGVYSYTILDTLGGTVTVGPGGSYSSLSGAGGLFAAINNGALTSNLTVNITGDTTEDGSVVLNAPSSNVYPNAFTVTIQPDSATMRTITGSGTSGLIRLDGAQRVILDGSFGGSGRYLTFRNTSTNSSSSTVLFINDASNNTVRNCVLEGVATSYGVVAFRAGAVTGNDNNTITGNQIRDRSDAAGVPAYLVNSLGSSDWVANSSNTVSNNDMFNFTGTGIGIFSGNSSWTITGNTLYQTTARTTTLNGIVVNSLGTNAVLDNTLHDLTSSGATTGITLGTESGSTTVSGNRLWNIGNTAGSTNLAYGILCQHTSGQSVTVVNNMIVFGSSGTTAQILRGIYDNGTAGSTTLIAYNSVLLTGSGGTFRDTWAFSYDGNSTATVKNNIFLNLRTGGSNHYAANFSTASTGTLAIDSNVYAGTGLSTAENFFDAGDGGNASDIPISYAQWQTNLPGDTHSSAGNPGGSYSSAMFAAPATSDLHLAAGGNALVNGAATPVPGLTTDFDGDTRSATSPVIGADEIPLPDIVVTQTIALSDAAGSVDIGNVKLGDSSTARTFTITNPGTLSLAGLVLSKDGTNAGDFSVSSLSGTSIPAGSGSVTFTVTFTPGGIGTRNAAIHIASNLLGAKNPFDIALIGTGLTAADSWRQSKFNTTSNTGNAADSADPNGNGIVNLIEYALNGDPTGSTAGTGILPTASANGTNHLQLAFTRYLDRNDITLTVQGVDSLTATWTDLAQSINGAALTVLASGASVNETGTGNTRAVAVGDLYLMTDPAHPQRFLRLKVTRP
ncbi:MAG: choice-of-anchor D domain-containing protein [Prosthecobacter sp.]|uniref:beta strand repeat-containing protein n=1 Tax=Prosthecobacter sp. TaxID=1965333 RepID=UPI0025E5D05D|nr:choice-of-anchor D domain-containing protein [Prosthecobacter sp.]MCF7788354.1 choice-of-anchor D domain-containing protein [Prosthecobacter sp.]